MLYTRKGDEGTTRAIDTKGRVSKTSVLFEALGTLDELNAHIGLCRAALPRVGDSEVSYGKKPMTISCILHDVQEHLFIIQAQLGGADKKIMKRHVRWLETFVDGMESAMPPIKTFFIPGATETSAMLDVLRTVARRAERRVVAVHESGDRIVPPVTLAYLNRLSSLMFALARFASTRVHAHEESPSY